MLGVYITINGVTIYARTAVRRRQLHATRTCEYETDTGELLRHDPKSGAIVLAKMLLDTIKVQKSVPAPDPEARRDA